jgi:proliferating cell nuclear antigen
MSQRPTPTEDDPASGPLDAVVDADPLQSALDAVAAVVDECVLQVGPDGLTVDAQDPATVALVSLDLPADEFEAYDAAETRLGVDLGRLRDVVGMADGDELVRLAVDEETRTLHVQVGELAYTLGLIDPDAVRSPPESTDFSEAFTATVALEGEAVADAVQAADMVSDHLELGVDPGEDLLYASAEGDTDTVRLEFPSEECAGFEAGEARSLYSVSYLDAITSVLPGDADLTLRTGEEAPMSLSFSLDGADVTYVVAPRISKR